MNANYSEALEKQIALMRQATFVVENEKHGGGGESDDVCQAATFAQYILGKARTFFWEPQMCMLLEKSADSIPNWQLSADHLPAPSGFCMLGRELTAISDHPGTHGLRAFGWALKPDRNGILVMEWLDHEQFSLPIFHNWLTWLYGESLTDLRRRLTGDDITVQQASMLAARFAAMCALLEQSIITPRSQRVERHAAKRIEKAGFTDEPVVRIIELRRKWHLQGKTTEATERDWACQWLVRGHWRQQACGPKHGQRQPRWITPYVKGPDDKPLKAPRATVFAVVR